MERWISVLGLVVMVALAWLMSADKKRQDLRLILSGIGLQIVFAFLILKTSVGLAIFDVARKFINQIISFSDAGSAFVFGASFKEHLFAFSVLPTIIFVSSIMAVLFHLGVMQWIVKGMAKIMVWVMNASGSESLASAANVFVGQTEAPLVIKPYLNSMTRAELMVLMTGGMATVAGGVMAAYVGLGVDAGHLLAASVMSAPAAIVIARIMLPEKEESVTKGVVKIEIPKQDENVLDAACRGASEGAKLAFNVGAMLIAFIAIVSMLDYSLSFIGNVSGEPLTFARVLGFVLQPLAWTMGVPWGEEAKTVGVLLGEKMMLNEFVAYVDLTTNYKEKLSPRSFTIATYALCGFANFSSIAIQIGGIGGLVPERRKDFAQLGFKAMIGGTLAAYMTACIAGFMIE